MGFQSAKLYHRDSSQEPFWDISHNNSNQEDDGVQPVVSQNKCYNEEDHTQEDSHSSNDVNEVMDFLSDRRLS